MPELEADLRAVVIRPPDRLVERQAVVSVGGRPVTLAYHGRAHTDHDLVVAVPDAGVVFAGDIIEEGNAPWFGDGYPLDWPATLDAFLAGATRAGDRAGTRRGRGPRLRGAAASCDRALADAIAERVRWRAHGRHEVVAMAVFPEATTREALGAGPRPPSRGGRRPGTRHVLAKRKRQDRPAPPAHPCRSRSPAAASGRPSPSARRERHRGRCRSMSLMSTSRFAARAGRSPASGAALSGSVLSAITRSLLPRLGVRSADVEAPVAHVDGHR